MGKNSTRMILLIAVITFASYLVYIFLKYYNSPEKIEERCTYKFQKDLKKGAGKSDDEWGLNMDLANENYFECMKIP